MPNAAAKISPRRSASHKSSALRRPIPLLTLLHVGVITTTLLTVGCQAPPPPAGPTAMTLHVADRDAFINAALTRLRECDLEPDFVNPTAGLIITTPTTSAQWFEFWRVDSPGAYQTLESSLHTIRRIVRITLRPADPHTTQPTTQSTQPVGMPYQLTVQVDKQRLNAPQRQITTASGALSIYSQRVPTAQGTIGAASRDIHWVPLGRDPLLEEYLLKELARLAPAQL